MENKSGAHAVKGLDNKVRYEVKEILEVWREHFGNACKPKNSTKYDDDHFKKVTGCVKEWYIECDTSDFLAEPF